MYSRDTTVSIDFNVDWTATLATFVLLLYTAFFISFVILYALNHYNLQSKLSHMASMKAPSTIQLH